MARTTTVTHADGTVSKRTSKSRVYSHAVVVEESRERTVADAQDLANSADEAVRLWSGIVATMTEADVTVTRRPWGRTGVEWVTVNAFGDHYLTSFPSDREEDLSIEALRAKAQEILDRTVEVERRRLAALEEAKGGPERTFGVLRWSSREDLARKAAEGEFGRLVREGVKVYVVECQEA